MDNLADSRKEALSRRARAAGYLATIMSLFALLPSLLIFIIPIYTVSNGGPASSPNFLSALSTRRNDIGIVVCLIIGTGLLIASALIFISCLRLLKKGGRPLALRNAFSCFFSYGITVAFFVLGLIMSYYKNSQGYDASTISWIPMLACTPFALLNALLRAFTDDAPVKKRSASEKRRRRIFNNIILLSVSVFSALSLVTVFMDTVIIRTTVGSVTDVIKVSGFDLIKNPAAYGSSFRTLAFALTAMMIVILVSLTFSLTSYLSRSREFEVISKTAIIAEYLFIFAVATFGLYYKIVQTANEEMLLSVLDSVGIDVQGYLFHVSISSPVIYPLIAASVLGVALIALKPFSRIKDESAGTVGDIRIEKAVASGGEKSAIGSSAPSSFDSCPAFTAADNTVVEIAARNKKREKSAFGPTNLPEVVDFIVDYARESRLHLSYSHEDIADFIAGLGASRLTILQGMSGTGKTSLPKIFTEAIMGTCDIIEVESSWKDKNELIGYYNEFSRTFTPKKFTLSLYAAALDPVPVTFIVLDEMNLSRIEYYFSDFLSLMENEEDKRYIRLSSVPLIRTENGSSYEYAMLENGNSLKIPPSIWFIGTANRDESTFEISDKVYDRAHTMNFIKRAPKAVPRLDEPLKSRYITYGQFRAMLEAAVSSRDFDVENNEVVKAVEKLLEPYNISFGNRVLLQIERYVRIYSACFLYKSNAADEALEKILLTKLVSKLEFKSISDKETLCRGFERIGLQKCAEFVSRLNEDSFYG